MSTGQDQSVIELLVDQHRQVKECFDRLKSGQGAKEDQFHELVRLLAVHESAEEQIVHPAARRAEAGDDVVRQRLVEESEAKKTLSELYDLGVEHPDFDKKLAEFADAVLEHARHEESEEFSAMAAHLSPEELRRMAGAVRAAEAIAPTRPHPAAGESPLANLIAGPPLAVFDRVRDAVRDWRSANDK
ncbi:hemerythrin domain-containing protein [Nocardia brasiliensis]|uniref:hemerythrin domain-containing protein n=1 Tax=Nocardia brasiliensis TaxID=37326 RepID=UPI00366F0A2C